MGVWMDRGYVMMTTDGSITIFSYPWVLCLIFSFFMCVCVCVCIYIYIYIYIYGKLSKPIHKKMVLSNSTLYILDLLSSFKPGPVRIPYYISYRKLNQGILFQWLNCFCAQSWFDWNSVLWKKRTILPSEYNLLKSKISIDGAFSHLLQRLC